MYNAKVNDRNVIQLLRQKRLFCLFQAKDLWRYWAVYKYKGHNQKGCIWLGKWQVYLHQSIFGIDWVYVFCSWNSVLLSFFTCLISIPYSSECLMFYSKFECGNLRKAIQVRRYVFWLFLLVLWQFPKHGILVVRWANETTIIMTIKPHERFMFLFTSLPLDMNMTSYWMQTLTVPSMHSGSTLKSVTWRLMSPTVLM